MHNMFVHVALRPHSEQFPTPLLASSCQGPIALLRCDTMVIWLVWEKTTAQLYLGIFMFPKKSIYANVMIECNLGIRDTPATHAEPANFSPGYPDTMPVQTPVKSICRISCPFDEVEDGFVVAALIKAADGGGVGERCKHVFWNLIPLTLTTKYFSYQVTISLVEAFASKTLSHLQTTMQS